MFAVDPIDEQNIYEDKAKGFFPLSHSPSPPLSVSQSQQNSEKNLLADDLIFVQAMSEGFFYDKR